MNRKNIRLIIGIILIGVLIFALTSNLLNNESQVEQLEYKTISAKEAKKQLDANKDIVLLDVRTPQEYEEKHIPGSTLVPLNTIEEKISGVISDKETKVFVYCRSGNRSKNATELLVKLGYTNVYDMGGINSWPYETQSL